MQRADKQHVVTTTVTLLISLIILTTFQLGALDAHAASVEKVRGALAIVAFSPTDTPPTVGEKFFALENGKKKALLQVVQFKNGRAKVKIVKGNAKEGMSVASVVSGGASVSKSAAPKGDDAEEAADAADSAASAGSSKHVRSAGKATLFRDMTVGLVVGYGMDSQTVTSAALGTQAMTGTGFSAKGFADIPVTGPLGLLARVGAEQFNVKANSFTTEIMYATVDLLLKYGFSEGTFIPFAMGGLGLHFPISKTSNILSINQISSTTVFYGGGGFNWALGGSTYFQVTAEYGMFPPSNDVSTSFIAARTGLGFRF